MQSGVVRAPAGTAGTILTSVQATPVVPATGVVVPSQSAPLASTATNHERFKVRSLPAVSMWKR